MTPNFLNKSTLGVTPNREFKEKVSYIFEKFGFSENMPWPEFLKYMIDSFEDKAQLLSSERQKYETVIDDFKNEVDRLNTLNTELNNSNSVLNSQLEQVNSNKTVLQNQLNETNSKLQNATFENETTVVITSTPANIYVLKEWATKQEKSPSQILIDEMFMNFAINGLCDVDYPRLNMRVYNDLCNRLNK
jgi:hypothetical protein